MRAGSFDVVTVLSLLLELVAFRPVRRASAVMLLITSFAVSYGLQELGWMTVGTGPQKGVEPYPWLTSQHNISGVLISNLEVLTWILIAMFLAVARPTLSTLASSSSLALLTSTGRVIA